MPGPRPRLAFVSFLALAWAASCAVFPDEALLPEQGGNGLAGGGAQTVSGSAGRPVDPVSGADSGGVGSGGVTLETAGEGGSSSVGMGGMPAEPAGGVGGAGGAGGEGGVIIPSCATPAEYVGPVTDDTWIDSLSTKATNGPDQLLRVVGGAGERRALMQLGLPAVPEGATLVDAKLILHLESNSDTSLAPRSFELHRLTRVFVESRTSWLAFSNGSKGAWATAGGDFESSPLGSAELPADGSSVDVTLSFDVTKMLAKIFAADEVPLAMIVLETGQVPPAPAELAFTSSEGNASAAPSLVVHYCMP